MNMSHGVNITIAVERKANGGQKGIWPELVEQNLTWYLKKERLVNGTVVSQCPRSC